MKAKKSIVMAVAASLTGLVAIALSGCEWFSFEKRGKEKDVATSYGHDEVTAEWLASKATSSRSDALALYEEARNSNAIGPDVTFLEFLKALNDDSASLTSPLRASVAIAAQSGLGSGVIYSIGEADESGANAYVITNYHVVYGDGGIGSVFYTYLYGDTYAPSETTENALQATYVGGAMDEDIAVLSVKIPAERLDFVQSIVADFEKADSDDINVGEKVYAVGNVLGGGISVVSGIVSVKAEDNTFSKISDSTQAVVMNTMRIDAPVTHGNSGGGLFNSDGKLVGIVNGGKETAKNGSETIDVDGYGFALPVNRAIAVVQSIIDNSLVADNNSKAANYARLGELQILSSEGRFDPDYNTVDIVEKVAVSSVNSKSPFAGSGIEGRVLTKIVIRDASENVKYEKEITRKHQVLTALYNVRKDYFVELFFEDDPNGVMVQYTDGLNHFEQVG